MKPPYQGSLQEYDVFEKKDVMIEMRDGIKLACDIYFPSEKNKISNLNIAQIYSNLAGLYESQFFYNKAEIYNQKGLSKKLLKP